MPDAPNPPERPGRPDGQPETWRRGPRGRPPWWPEGEPFPPREGWGRRRFLRRMAIGAGVFLLVWFIAGAVIGWFFWHGSQQPQAHRGPYFGGFLFVVLLLVGGVLLLRRLFRRTALPLQD